MRSYRFRNERVYRRRRAWVISILVALIACAVFFVFFRGDDNSNSALVTPTPTSTPPVATESPSPTSTPEPTPTPTPEPEGTYTESHGFLPAIGSLPPSGRMDELKKMVEDFVSQQSKWRDLHRPPPESPLGSGKEDICASSTQAADGSLRISGWRRSEP